MKSRLILVLLFVSGRTVNAAAQANDQPKTAGSNFGHLPGTPLTSETDSLEVHRFGDGTRLMVWADRPNLFDRIFLEFLSDLKG